MSFWSNSQYFPKSRTLLFSKQNGVLSYICREFFGSDVTPDTTELQDTVKRLVFMQQNVKFHLIALLA